MADLKPEHIIFVQNYVIDWNATKAYQIAYPGSSYNAARSSACDLLTNPNIKAYIDEVKNDLEKLAGVSKLKILLEHKKLAFSSIAHLHNTWIERKDFEDLTDEQKECIQEISIKKLTEKRGKKLYDVEYVKIKLYDKQRALDSMAKLLGYDAPNKVDVRLGGGPTIEVRSEEDKKLIEDVLDSFNKESE